LVYSLFFFFFQAEDGIRDWSVTGVQTCALPIYVPLMPRAMIIGCVDQRVDPAHVLGLGLGEAIVIRNIGGRITPATLETMGMLKIGRASCRERVEISVVAVSIEEKKIKEIGREA